jgi:hypothetical protein
MVRMMTMVHLVQYCEVAGEEAEHEDDEDGSPGAIVCGSGEGSMVRMMKMVHLVQ